MGGFFSKYILVYTPKKKKSIEFAVLSSSCLTELTKGLPPGKVFESIFGNHQILCWRTKGLLCCHADTCNALHPRKMDGI